MFEKLAQIEKSYDELTEQISQPEFMSDMSAYAKLMKQHRSLGEIVEKYREMRKMQEGLQGAFLNLIQDFPISSFRDVCFGH